MVSLEHREKVYREYMEFFERAERQRRWHWLDDVPWDALDANLNEEADAVRIETFCGVELYVPDYTAHGFNLTRECFGHAWFQANWGYEESKHALVFREYLLRSGLRNQAQYADFEEKVLARHWNLPFATRRQMTCYGAIQEMATYQIYSDQKKRHRETTGNRVLEQIFHLVARDEAAHQGFYRSVLRIEFEEDYEGALRDLAHVVFHFRMPGVGLIPEYERRLEVDGVGISSQQFLMHGLFPTLRSLGTTRSELVRALRRRRLQDEAMRSELTAAPSDEAVAEIAHRVTRSQPELAGYVEDLTRARVDA